MRQWLILTLAAAALLLHIAHFYPYVVDDAFISLRYAERFIHGQGLTWNDGERVEGYSNLLWILLVSGLGVLGMDLVDATLLLGILCSLATLLVIFHYGRRS